MLPWKLRKRQILPVNQNLSSVYFSLAKFQLVSCNLPLAMTWQMTYNSQTAKTVFSHLNRRLSASAIRLSKWTKFLQFDNNRKGGEKTKSFITENNSIHRLNVSGSTGPGGTCPPCSPPPPPASYGSGKIDVSTHEYFTPVNKIIEAMYWRSRVNVKVKVNWKASLLFYLGT